MYKPREAEKFVENLIVNKIPSNFIELILNTSDNFLYSNLSNINVSLDQGSFNTSKSINYFSNYEINKILQNFIDLYFQRNGSKINFSNSIYCSTKYNKNLNGEYIVFPDKKAKYISGTFLNDYYKLINNIYEVSYSDYIKLSDKIIKNEEDLNIFVNYFNKNGILIKSNKDKDLTNLNIHNYFAKLTPEKINDMIKFFIENYPYILYKYFEPKNNIERIHFLEKSVLYEIEDSIDSPTNILLNGNFVFIKYSIFEEEKYYIRILLKEKNI